MTPLIPMTHSPRTHKLLLALAALPIILLGCNSTPTPQPAARTPLDQPITHYPARPSVPPPPFKVFHQDAQGITLVAPENATDDQIEAILWQLRDAAHSHTFDTLHISQKLVDARDPMVWFHLYRGAKCASEKFTKGPLPCGAAYHAAGDFTLGSFADKDKTDGALLHDENHQTELWDPTTKP
jgi:hypothetical protein